MIQSYRTLLPETEIIAFLYEEMGEMTLMKTIIQKKIMLMKFSEIWSLTFLSLSLRYMSVYVLVSS